MATKDTTLTTCNFCDADETQRHVMVKRDRDNAICDICIVLCVRVLAQRDKPPPDAQRATTIELEPA